MLRVVGDEIILDCEHIHEDDGGFLQLPAQVVAGFTQQLIELLGGIVELCEASMLIQVTIVVPRHRKLRWQASQRTCPMYPELPRTVLMQCLHLLQGLNNLMVVSQSSEHFRIDE
jgi:hypothetical protein